nr:relaxase domain-containing protein [Burkholderiaceae bacterium]
MMTVGTPVSASGAEAYFKADFIKQETLRRMSADKNNEADKNIEADEKTSIDAPADAEAMSPVLNNSETEDSDGENLKTLKDENTIAEPQPIGKSGSEETPAKNLIAKNLSAEVSAVKDLSLENLSIENPGVENSQVENSQVENSTVEQSNPARDQPDFAQTRTRWVGKLSEELGLTEEVSEKNFAALSRGIHPQTGERFIRHVKPRTVTNENGKTHQTKSHRAGLDQTLNAPKSVSLVAPYDERVITAHWRSAIKAIETIEEFTTAKMGNVKPPERTGKAAYAAFLHFEARPDFKSNFAAPDLHTHFFKFNFVRTADEQYRALETREVYRCQKLATAVYRSELLKEMTGIGYEMRIDERTDAPEVASISRAYIEASSPRQTEIKRTAEELGIKSTKIVASNYRRSKNFDPVEMRRRWDALDVEFGGQAAKAAENARHRTEIIKSEKQTFSSQRQILDSPDTAEKSAIKAVAAVDFVIAQAKQQKDIEVSKRKWITRQSLLTEALNYSPAELRIDDVKAEFIKREKNGELREFEIDRRKTKLQAEPENPNTEKANSASLISERVIKSDESASFGNLEDIKTQGERQTDQPRRTSLANTKNSAEDSLSESAVQKPVIQDQVIETDPAMTARLNIPALESDNVVKDSTSELPPVHRTNRKDFASEEKSAAEVLSNPELPNPITLPEKIETNHRETSEIKLAVNQESEKSLEKIYDKPGILQSRTRTSGSRNGEIEITADHTNSGERNDRSFRDGRFGSRDDTFQSSIIIPITDDAAAIGHTAFVGSIGTGESEPNITDYGAEHHRESSDSASETQTGAEQNSLAGRRERELPDRGGSAGSGKSDERRIIGEGVEKSESGGEPDQIPFKPIESIENENAVKAKPDFQPKTSQMEAAPRLESGAGISEIKIVGAKSAPLRDNRTNDQATRGGQEITGNDGADFSGVELNGAENTGVDEDSERGIDRREKRNEKFENGDRKTELGAATSRTGDEFGENGIEDSDERTGTLSSPFRKLQIASNGGFEGEGSAGSRISDGDQRATGNRTSTSTKSIGADEGADRFDSATNSGSEGISNFKGTESREKSRVDDSPIETFSRAADSIDAGGGLLFWNEQGFEREFGSTATNDGRITAKIIGDAG